MLETLPQQRRRRWILVGVTLLLVGWVVWSARGALIPFVIGGIVAYLMAPIVARIQRLFPTRGRLGRVARPMAIVVAYLVVIAILVGAGFYLVPPLVRQTTAFFEDVPAYWADVQREIDGLLAQYREQVPTRFRERIEANLDTLGAQVGEAVRAGLMVTFSAVSTIIGFVAGLALLPLWMFYVLKDQTRGLQRFYELWPESWRPDVRNIVGIIDRVLAAYIRGQLLLGIIIGVVTGIAMWIIGIDQALVLGLAAGVTELIPILGPWLGFLVAAGVTLATSPGKLPLVAIAFLGIQQLENTFLVPKVQGDAVRVHPAAIMVLLVIGGALWGIWGMIIVVPVAAILRDIFVYLYARFGEE